MKSLMLIAALLLSSIAHADVLLAYKVVSWGEGAQLTVAEQHETFAQAQQSLILLINAVEINNASPLAATRLYLLDALITPYTQPADSLFLNEEQPTFELDLP